MTVSERLRMPSLGGATEWLNSEPLGPAELRGHVVLVNFWTLTCINWLRQEPYVRAWSQAYRDDGLIVVGVHTPEFSFEHELDRVRQATKDMAIDYPVAVDNDYAIWSAFDNHYWPALYFVDAEGIVRDQHFGEGRYEQSERVIQQLLGVERELVSVEGLGVEAEADWDHLRTPETYLGYERSERFASQDGAAFDERRTYELPDRLRLNHWALGGEWTIRREQVVLDQAGGSIAYRFHARDAHLVLSHGAREPISFAPRRQGARPLTRRRHRRGGERPASARPPLPPRASARRGPRADTGDHVRPARRRGIRVHIRLGTRLMNRVRLMVVGNSMEAETICGLLRTEGIACDHRQTDMGAGAGDAVGDSGPREILVAQDDLESARQLVTTDTS